MKVSKLRSKYPKTPKYRSNPGQTSSNWGSKGHLGRLSVGLIHALLCSTSRAFKGFIFFTLSDLLIFSTFLLPYCYHSNKISLTFQGQRAFCIMILATANYKLFIWS